jgi:hypothetical protein
MPYMDISYAYVYDTLHYKYLRCETCSKIVGHRYPKIQPLVLHVGGGRSYHTKLQLLTSLKLLFHQMDLLINEQVTSFP